MSAGHIPDVARRSIVPFVYASVLLHLAAVCLATTVADANPEWFQVIRPGLHRGAVSMNLAASVERPRREQETPVRMPPPPTPMAPTEMIERRRASDPEPTTPDFAVAAVGTRVPLPQLEANRSPTADSAAANTLQSAVPPPRRSRELIPRETAADVESISAKPAAANSGAATLETPARLFNPEPHYPREAWDRGEHGVVKIRVQLDLNGHVTAAAVYQSSGFPLLDASALATAYRWRYAIARSAGAPKVVEFVEPFKFRHPLYPD